MKAIVFAAGLGTRLRPITDTVPKALVEVGGKTMLQRVLEKLRISGIRDVVVNVHHFPDMIIDFLKANNSFGLNINISDERDRLLDTGGGILSARKYLDDGEPFLVHNADILTDFDVNKMIDRHEKSGADVTLLVADRKSSRYLLFDEDMKMRGWTNVKTGECRPEGLEGENLRCLAFGGVHVMSPSVFPLLENYGSASKVFSITPFYIDICDKMDIRGYMPDEKYNWLDIGKPETLEKARQMFEK